MMKITNNMLDNAKEGKLYLQNASVSQAPSEFSFVLDKKVYNGLLSEVDDVAIANRIMTEFEQVSSNWYIQEASCVYKYCITNGLDYELRSDTIIYTNKFFTEKEFMAMCEEAKRSLKEKDHLLSDWNIANYLVDNFDFFFLEWGYTFSTR